MIRTFFLSLLCFFLGGISLVSAAPQAFLQASNATVGETVNVHASGLRSFEQTVLELQRPDDSILTLKSVSDKNGILTLPIHSVHTQKAGIYTITLKRSEGDISSSFEMFSNIISPYTSSVVLTQSSLEADGEAEGRITVSVRDAFDNPIANAPIRFLSSRNDDYIVGQHRTDTHGNATAKIKSQTPGTSTISVLAKDTLLFQKPEIVFFLSNTHTKNVGNTDESYGEFLRAQIFGDDIQNQIAYFTIENLPSEAIVNETITFKAVAKDINGDRVPNFLGTVRFSSSDDRAILPPDYTFTPEDQGEHTFFLATSYGTPGQHTLAIHDLEDFRISGEASINVVLGKEKVTPPSNPALQIITPQSGTYQMSRATITGQAQNVEAVRLMDGQITLIEDLEVDSEGNFVYQTPRLGDGTHIFQAFDMYSDLTSNQVTIQIDSTPPEGLSVVVEPQGLLNPGQEFDIFVTANEPLSSVRGIFQQVLTQLIPSDDGFKRTLTAPLEEGSYPVHVIASDALGNEIRKDNAGIIQVKLPEEEPLPPEPAPKPKDPVSPPGTVKNLHTQSGSSLADDAENKVTLFWSPPEGENTPKQYKVEIAEVNLFGDTTIPEDEIGVDDDLFSDLFAPEETESEEEPLLEKTDSDIPADPTSGEILFFNDFNLTPDNRTQWYVDGLQDDKKYFFRVVTIAEDGQESPASEPVEGLTPGAVRALNTPKPSAPKGDLVNSGTESSIGTVIALIIALLGGTVVTFFWKRRQV